jgi:glycosyltransferase involved in cell wall biosynthesis
VFISKAIESVLNQTYINTEIIIIDDGSTDKTKDIVDKLIKQYPSKIRYLRIKHVGLLGVVRNQGLKIANGEYVAFLDSDDQWIPNKLELQINIFNKYQNIGLVSSNAKVKDDFEKKLSYLFFPIKKNDKGIKKIRDLLTDNYIIISSAVARKSLIEQIGLFTDNPLLRAIEDYDLWLRLSTITKIYYLSEPLTIYSNRKNSIRNEISLVQYWKGMIYILDRFKKLLLKVSNKDDRLDDLILKKEASFYYNLGINYWKENEYLESTKSLLIYLKKRLMCSH